MCALRSSLEKIWKPTILRGFLPSVDPPTQSKNESLENILRAMPVVLEDGSPGILATPNKIEEVVENDLMQEDLQKIATANPQDLYAYFRDYTFLASAYLLEPTYHEFIRTGSYGVARNWLPEKIAHPLLQVSNILETRPFMEYNQSYALYNWYNRAKGRELWYNNIGLIRKLHGGQSEEGFIKVHVDMVAKSCHLVNGVSSIIAKDFPEKSTIKYGLLEITDAMDEILLNFHNMWGRSNPKDYAAFRSFIFGIANQPQIFPEGVRYGNEIQPRFYRGESGANDSMIPLLDNFVELTYPKNDLTDALRDFRSYRPNAHIQYLARVQKDAQRIGIRKLLLEHEPQLYHKLLTQIATFREMHWSMTQKYIIERSEYPVATGGTPITRWLPNQLYAVRSRIAEDFPMDKYNSLRMEELQENL